MYSMFHLERKKKKQTAFKNVQKNQQ